MARTRKSHETVEENTQTRSGQRKPPFSPKVAGNRYVIYVAKRSSDPDKTPQVIVSSFNEWYAVRYFMMKLIGKDTYEDFDFHNIRTGIKTSDGIEITMPQKGLVKQILGYEPTDDEAIWEDLNTKTNALRIKYGQVERDDPEGETGEKPAKDAKVRAEPKPKREKAPKADKKPSVDKSGMVSAITIAEEFKLEGREIRGILRASKLTKPEGGWMWKKDSKELKEARKVISEGVEALKKKGKKK